MLQVARIWVSATILCPIGVCSETTICNIAKKSLYQNTALTKRQKFNCFIYKLIVCEDIKDSPMLSMDAYPTSQAYAFCHLEHFGILSSASVYFIPENIYPF